MLTNRSSPLSVPQAGKVPFCKFHLGDRPIPVTFKRAIAALSLWQKARLAWGLCFLSDPIRYTIHTYMSVHSFSTHTCHVNTRVLHRHRGCAEDLLSVSV